jgi:hypothetical protein
MSFGEINAVYCMNHKKFTHTLCEQIAKFLMLNLEGHVIGKGLARTQQFLSSVFLNLPLKTVNYQMKSTRQKQ